MACHSEDRADFGKSGSGEANAEGKEHSMNDEEYQKAAGGVDHTRRRGVSMPSPADIADRDLERLLLKRTIEKQQELLSRRVGWVFSEQ